MSYLKWSEQIITDFSSANIEAMYGRGFVFTRPQEGLMQQTRSIRIDLSKFELSSENKRILRKTEDLQLTAYSLPYKNYNWEIGKLAKDFYSEKFGDGTFSANKVKELLTGGRKDFNKLLVYIFSPYQGELEGVIPQTYSNSSAPKDPSHPPLLGEEFTPIGYCIAVETDKLIHYSYPFYQINNQQSTINNLGMGMMLRAIIYAQESGKKYIYLGSFQRPTDIYKLQFKGLEWFDGSKWNEDFIELKNALTEHG